MVAVAFPAVNWKTIYNLAKGVAPDTPQFDATVSRWKNLDSTQKRMAEIKASYDASRPALSIDDAYSGDTELFSRKELLVQLHKQFAIAQEPKLRTDILMKIADLERFKDTDGTREPPKRYYLPLTCKDCRLYQLGEQGIQDFLVNNEKSLAK